MEHKIVLGGEQFLPFARNCITKLKRLGVPYASQSFEVDGASIRVRVAPGHEHIRIDSQKPGNIYLFLKATRYTADAPSSAYAEDGIFSSALIAFKGVSTKASRYKVLANTAGTINHRWSDSTYTILESGPAEGEPSTYPITQSHPVAILVPRSHHTFEYACANLLEDVAVLPGGLYKKFGKLGSGADSQNIASDGGYYPRTGGWDIWTPTQSAISTESYTQRVVIGGVTFTETYSYSNIGDTLRRLNNPPGGVPPGTPVGNSTRTRTESRTTYIEPHKVTKGEFVVVRRDLYKDSTQATVTGSAPVTTVITDTLVDTLRYGTIASGTWVVTDYTLGNPIDQYTYNRPDPIQGCSYLTRETWWETGKQKPVYVPLSGADYTRQQARIGGTGFPKRLPRWGWDYNDCLRQGSDFIQLSERYVSVGTNVWFNRVFDRSLTGIPPAGVDRMHLIGTINPTCGTPLPLYAVSLSRTTYLNFYDPTTGTTSNPRYIQLVEIVGGVHTVRQQIDLYAIPAVSNNAAMAFVIDGYSSAASTTVDEQCEAGHVRLIRYGQGGGVPVVDSTYLDAYIMVDEDVLMQPDAVWYTPGLDGVYPPA